MPSGTASRCFKSAPRAPGRRAAGETVLANTSAAGIALAVFTRTFDAVSNPLTVLELDGTVVSYGYDATYQLILEQRSGANAYNTSYDYDPVGNRLQKSDSGAVTTGVYDAADQQTLIVPPTGAATTQSWDGSGNLALSNTGGVLTTYSWDGENRLATLQNPGAAASTYLYSSDTGYRQVASAPAGYTRYLWDEQNVLAEQDASHNLIAAYTNDPGNWGGLASQRRSGSSTFYGYDQQGSARILAGTSGSVTDNYSFKAFGEELQSGSGTVNPYRFGVWRALYRDDADRLSLFGSFYQPTVGRFAASSDHEAAGYAPVIRNWVLGPAPLGGDPCSVPGVPECPNVGPQKLTKFLCRNPAFDTQMAAAVLSDIAKTAKCPCNVHLHGKMRFVIRHACITFSGLCRLLLPPVCKITRPRTLLCPAFDATASRKCGGTCPPVCSKALPKGHAVQTFAINLPGSITAGIPGCSATLHGASGTLTIDGTVDAKACC